MKKTWMALLLFAQLLMLIGCGQNGGNASDEMPLKFYYEVRGAQELDRSPWWRRRPEIAACIPCRK